MKYIYFTILVTVLYCSKIKGQTIDYAFIKCSYKYSYLKDTLNRTLNESDLLILQVGKNISKCYSYYTFQSDSLKATANGKKIWRELFNKAIQKDGINATSFPYRRLSTYIYKNYPKGKTTVTDNISLQYYIYTEPISTQNWQLVDSTKIILNYPCQMAVCSFRGREWTAWFAPNIPVSDGPWKLGGLPGLIMEAYDHNSQYHFTINGLQKIESEPIIFSKKHVESKKFDKTNRIDFLKAQKRYLMNMNGYVKIETGIDIGREASNSIMQYDLLECDYK